MSKPWHTISDLQNNPEVTISAKITTNEESPWFSGHFPGFPLLPGIAQVGFVFETIKKYEESQGKKVRLLKIKRIRYKRIIKPNEIISLEVKKSQKQENSFGFTLHVDNELACKGTVLTEEIG